MNGRGRALSGRTCVAGSSPREPRACVPHFHISRPARACTHRNARGARNPVADRAAAATSTADPGHPTRANREVWRDASAREAARPLGPVLPSHRHRPDSGGRDVPRSGAGAAPRNGSAARRACRDPPGERESLRTLTTATWWAKGSPPGRTTGQAATPLTRGWPPRFVPHRREHSAAPARLTRPPARP